MFEKEKEKQLTKFYKLRTAFEPQLDITGKTLREKWKY